MKRYAKILDVSKGTVEVGVGSDSAFYASIGMKIMDVEKGCDGIWYLIGKAPQRMFDDIKSSKLDEINAEYQRAIATLTPTYPDDERLTFDKQEQEARSWLADNSTSTPFIDALAAGRQMDKDELVNRIIAKADAFAFASGLLTGQRQRYEDLLDVAETPEAVAAIAPEYSLPGMEAQA